MAERQRNWPASCWQFDFEVPVSLTDRYGGMISIAGSVALDAKGQMRAPGDLAAQTAMVNRELAMTVEGAEAGTDAIAKLVAFYVGEGEAARRDLLDGLRGALPQPDGVAITAIPVRNLAFPGMMLEVEGYAFAHGPDALPRRAPVPGVVAVDEFVFVDGRCSRDEAGRPFTGDIVHQTLESLERVRSGLAAAGAEMEDVVRLNVYYVSDGGMADLTAVAGACARRFISPGPVVSFVPLPSLGHADQLVELDVIAMPGTGGRRPPRESLVVAPDWHWPEGWPFQPALRCGNAAFIGGQLPFDAAGNVLHAGDMAAQTRLVMDRIAAMLGQFDIAMNEIMKVGCWYDGAASVDTLKRNALVRSSYFTKPGPTSTGVPLDALCHPKAQVQVDVVAMAPRMR